MNVVYNLVWNSTLNAWVAVSELTRKRGKANGQVKKNRVAKSGHAAALMGAMSIAAIGLGWHGSAQAQVVINSTVNENGTTHTSSTGPGVNVVAGGNYTTTGVTIGSTAPSGSALYVNTGGIANLDATTTVSMAGTSGYGIQVDGAGSLVTSAATASGTTGGAGVYNGGRLVQNGGSLSGLFGLVVSGATSTATATNSTITANNSSASGVRAELGGHVDLIGGTVTGLNNLTSINAEGAGSVITTNATQLNGAAQASNGGALTLSGGALLANGFGVAGLSAFGTPASSISASNLTVTAEGSNSSVAFANNGAQITLDSITGSAWTRGVQAGAGGSRVTATNSNFTAGSIGAYAFQGGTISLTGGSLNTSFQGIGLYAENAGSTITSSAAINGGGGSSSIGATARTGGSIVLQTGSVITGMQIGLHATAGSSVTSDAIVTAYQQGVLADGGTINVNSGRFTTLNAGATGFVANGTGVVNVANAGIINNSVFSTNGLSATAGGRINLAGGTVNLTGANGTALSTSGAGSSINTTVPLSINGTGTNETGVALASGATQSYTGLNGTLTGAGSVAIGGTTGTNTLNLTGSTLSATAAGISNASGTLNVNLTDSDVLSNAVLLRDNGSIIHLIANTNSLVRGTAAAINSTVALSGGSVWELGAGASTLSSLTLDNGTLRLIGAGTLNAAGGVVLNAGGGTIDTNGFNATIAASDITGAGDLDKDGAGTLTLDGGINHAGDTFINAGTLQIGNGGANGTVNLHDVFNEGTLAFNRSDVVTVGGAISGSGSVQQNGSGTTVFTADTTYMGETVVNAGVLQLGNGGSTGSVAGDVVVNAGGTLAIDRGTTFVLDNALSGTGLVTTQTDGNAFDFAASTGTAFAGTLAIGNSTFALDGVNTDALTNATLRMDNDSVTAVGNGDQNIGGLVFNGGTVIFNATAPAEEIATSHVVTNTLDASGAGTVRINLPDPYVPAAPDTPNAVNLLAQDDGNIGTQLVQAGSVIGSGGGLVLTDQLGNVLSDAHQVNVEQGGALVALATYDYRLTTAPGDGLYVNYGLTELDLQDEQTLTLSQDTGATGAAADLSARLTGAGSLSVEAGAGTLSLSNTLNDYTGETTAASGTLALAADNALGNTSALHIAGGATVAIGGYTQTIGTLDGVAGSTLDLGGGDLTLSNGGVSDGTLSGAGVLNVAGGLLDVNGANAGLTANTVIAASATVALDDVAGLGSGAITDDGTLDLEGVAGSLVNAISGSGDVNLLDASDVVLTGDNSAFAGHFDISSDSVLTASAAQNLGTASIADEGALVLDGFADMLANSISGSGDIALVNASDVVLSGDNSAFAGHFDISADSVLTASAAEHLGTASIADDGALVLDGYADILANSISGSGMVNVVNAADVVLAGNNSAFSGQFDIDADSVMTASLAEHLGTASIADAGMLVLDGFADTLANSISGTGDVNLVNAANVVLAADNSAFAGHFDIGADSILTASAAEHVGTASIADAGTLVLDGYEDMLVNSISGAGSVNLVNAADVVLGGNNSAFAGHFDISADSILTASTAEHLGTASIADAGTLVIDNATDWTIANAVSGAGNVIKTGGGTLTAGGALTYTGTTDITAGTLVVGSGVRLGGVGAGDVTVAAGATLAGAGTVSGKVINNGTVAALNAFSGAGSTAGGTANAPVQGAVGPTTFTLANGLVNRGTVNLAGSGIGNTLHVMGDYVGENGTVVLSTFMGDDTSATDKLVIDAGRASGNTSLVIKHGGGDGAATTQGIRVVETRNGGSTAADAFALGAASDGYRQGDNSIAAGAFTYRLVRGGKDGVANDWYLVSASGDVPVPEFRPEVGAYLANQAATRAMQLHTLHDRIGEADFSERQRGDARGAAAWSRVKGYRTRTEAGDGQLSIDSDVNLVQLGAEMHNWTDGDSRYHLGLMGQFGQASTQSESISGLLARGRVQGETLGAYGTWYQSADQATGLYVDGWLQYGRFNNRVMGEGLATEHYDSSAWTASVEAGYAFQIGQGAQSAFFIEPQAQAIYQRYHSDTFVETNGTTVRDASPNGVTTRLGARFYSRPVDASHNRVQPFVEANWWHNADAVRMDFDDNRVALDAPGNRYEIKGGAQLELSGGWTGWGDVSVQTGAGDYHDVQAQVGVKYSW